MNAKKKEQELILIEVQKYPALWDLRSPEFRKGPDKKKIWNSIALKLKLKDGKTVERAFKYLKAEYNKEKREQNLDSRSGSAATTRKPFPLFNAMQFLDRVNSENKDTIASNRFPTIDQPHTSRNRRPPARFSNFSASLPHPSLFIPSQPSQNEITSYSQLPQQSQNEITNFPQSPQPSQNEIMNYPQSPQPSQNEIVNYPQSPQIEISNYPTSPSPIANTQEVHYTTLQIHSAPKINADSVNPSPLIPHIHNQPHSQERNFQPTTSSPSIQSPTVVPNVHYSPLSSNIENLVQPTPSPILIEVPSVAQIPPIEFELVNNITPYETIVQVQIDAFEKIYRYSLQSMTPSQRFDMALDLTEICLKHNMNYEQMNK